MDRPWHPLERTEVGKMAIGEGVLSPQQDWGLVISDIAYSHYSFRWFHAWGFGAWIRCIGMVMAMAKEKQETVYQEECINTAVCTAIALQFISFRVSYRSMIGKEYLQGGKWKG